MSAITFELPNSIHKKLEELAGNGGFSIEQFLTSAASEKLSAMLQLDFLENEARLGSQKEFDDYLASAPDVKPIHPDDVIK
ncbi:MAG: toxin-antitoxin system HicB family antitoxin [Pyrinomonadaceae bacterium]